MENRRTGTLFSFISNLTTQIGKPFFNAILLSFYLFLIFISIILQLSFSIFKSLASGLNSLKLILHLPDLFSSYQHLTYKKKASCLFKTPLRQLIGKTKIKISKVTLANIAFIALLAGALLFAGGKTGEFLKQLPDPNTLTSRNQAVTTKIFDRNGSLLYKIFNTENRTPINLEEIPPYLIQATLSIEDKDFYRHPGYSYKGIFRAVRRIILEKKLQGGSTITQQLVKNALLSKEQTLQRKIKEIILAILVETKFTKDEILTMYFNEVSYGGATYGIEEAAQMYFSKSASSLTLSESALLAGLPAAPTYYSPFGTHPEMAKFRQHEVLRRMYEDKIITYEEMEKAKSEKLVLSNQKIDIKAPHFVMYVREILVEKFGEQLVEQGGLQVYTTLDLNIQELAQLSVSQELERLSRLNIKNGAALVTSPSTGEILAMVGSRDFFAFAEDGQVNVTLRPRQPGSAIKPVNYAVALENGLTAASLISDTPVTYHLPGQPDYSPQNYDNAFHGNVTLRHALANSYNVPAVKILSAFGVDQMLNKGKQLGITTWDDQSKYGLSLTLGGGEVTMKDLAEVYGSLANTGNHLPLNPLLQVLDYKGKTLYRNNCTASPFLKESYAKEEANCSAQKVVSPEIAFLLSDILSDNQARSPAFGLYSVLNIPQQQVAVKTGTTQNMRDNWTIGYTQDFLTAVWVGNNDNTSMSYVASGITGASPIWNRIMTALLSTKPPSKFNPPEAIITIPICRDTGLLACNHECPQIDEHFIRGTEPVSCSPPLSVSQQPKNETVPEDQ